MSVTWDKFHGAALLLAGAGPVKQRLADAFRTHLVDLEIEELPRELRAEFMSVSASLTSRRAMGGLGVIDATVRKLSDAQAAGYASATDHDVRCPVAVAGASAARSGTACDQVFAGVSPFSRA